MRGIFAPLLFVALSSSEASASRWEPATGTLSLEGAAASFAFEPGGPAGHVHLFKRTGKETLAARVLPDAVEGKGALSLGGEVRMVLLDLDHLAPALAGRRVEVTMWQRARGTRAFAALYWMSGDVATAIAAGSFAGTHPMGLLVLRPTGRATSDGWEELSSGPVDYALGGLLPLSMLAAWDVHDAGAEEHAFIGHDDRVRVSIDAVEVIDRGAAAVPSRECTLLGEDACGDAGVCSMGRCADAAVLRGSGLGEARRRHYVDRRLFELETFAGIRAVKPELPRVREAMRALALPSGESKRFWPALRELYETIRDGHASSPFSTYAAPLGTGVCLGLGEADLTGGGALPMVFEAIPSHPVAAQLAAGDVLVSIDGIDPDAWLAKAQHLVTYPGDPAGKRYVQVSELLNAAVQTGAKLTFERPGKRVSVDLAEALAPFWSGTPPAWRNVHGTCDFRFRRVAQTPAYEDAAFVDRDGVRFVQFNGFPALDVAPRWKVVMDRAFSGAPARVVIDERRGDGGSRDSLELLSGYLLGSGDFDRAILFPQLQRDGDVAAVRRCALADPDDGLFCGFARTLAPHARHTHPGAARASRVAVLTGRDVSGNDFFTRLVGYRSGETRTFGAVPTYGAFGGIFMLPKLAGEIHGGSVQPDDARFFVTPDDESAPFASGTGVAPHEVVLQKQSDAIGGIDTAAVRAEAWVKR